MPTAKPHSVFEIGDRVRRRFAHSAVGEVDQVRDGRYGREYHVQFPSTGIWVPFCDLVRADPSEPDVKPDTSKESKDGRSRKPR